MAEVDLSKEELEATGTVLYGAEQKYEELDKNNKFPDQKTKEEVGELHDLIQSARKKMAKAVNDDDMD